MPVVNLLRTQRQNGRRIILVSNGTNKLNEDIATAGVSNLFDQVYNSADLGVAKPSEAFYRYVSRLERPHSESSFFVDDRIANVVAATDFGWNAVVYESDQILERELAALP